MLDQGIRPVFYESEYAQYWQDVMFDNPRLAAFMPDLIFIHTSNRNIASYPSIRDQEEQVEALLSEQYGHFQAMWEKIESVYRCPVIQNNFEYPFYRLFGNQDQVYLQGRSRFVNRLNDLFYRYALEHENFYIHDINYLSASYGLDRWADPFYWHMYKYACCMQAIPAFAFNLSNMIKAVFGKNKKGLSLDLDNTLWGGIVGDDGPENLEIGQETSMGQVFAEFQTYVKAHKDIGVMLTVNSKNEEENALAGLAHPDGVLKPEDFVLIRANWEPKSKNLEETAAELNILPESFVFVDDNPAEREIVKSQVPGVAVPEIGTPEQYIRVLDHSGFFEVTNLSEDDRKRNDMYRANAERKRQQAAFGDYREYLLSLEMQAQIKPFEPMVMARVAQLTTRFGRLSDKFGDNGVVSVVIGRKGSLEDREAYRQNKLPEEDTGRDVLHLELWLMSCRVLKRDMECAMMDSVVEACRECGIGTIMGYYYPTAKNAMVKDFYRTMGFEKTEETDTGVTVWRFEIPADYEKKNTVINVKNVSEEAEL